MPDYKRITVPGKGAIHLWKPDSTPRGTVIHIHGYYDSADSAWKNHKLESQFQASGLDALFIVPGAPSSSNEGVTWPNLDELLAKSEAPAGPVVVIGHSGGFRTLVEWVKNPRVTHFIHLDSTYWSLKPFVAWVKEGDRKLDVVGATAQPNNEAKQALQGMAGVVKLTSMPSALTAEQKSAKILYIDCTAQGSKPPTGYSNWLMAYHMSLVTPTYGKDLARDIPFAGKVIPLLLGRAQLAAENRPQEPRNNPSNSQPQNNPPKSQPQNFSDSGGTPSGSGHSGADVLIPANQLPRKTQAEMGDTSWTHCGYCCKILVAHYLHKLKGNSMEPKWYQGIDTAKLMKGTGYAFDGYAVAAEVTSDGKVLRKEGAQEALRLVDTYLSMDPPLPVVVGVDHKAGTANKGFDIDHFVLVVGRQVKNGKTRYLIHDVGGGSGESYFEVKEGLLVKPGRDYRADPGGKVHMRRYIATAVARYRKDGSPPASSGKMVVPAGTTKEGDGVSTTDLATHNVAAPLVSRLKDVPDLLRLAMKKDIVLKKGCSYTDAVKAVQEALNKTQQAGLEPDGNFGKKTEAAVKAFQEHCIKTWRRAGAADKLAGFQPDGVVGPKTLLALDAALLEVDASLSGKDGQGVEVEVAPSCKAPPAEGEEKAYEAFREAIRAVGIFKDAPWEMNILGIRGFKDGARVPAGSGDFSDTLALVYVCEKGHKHAPQWPACTDPAAGVDGKPDVHLHEGQYAYKMDQDGLSPRGAVKVWLDTAEDGVKRSDDPVVEGIYAARIVPNPGGTLSDLEGGLQVLQGNARSEAWKTFWSLLQSDPDQSYFYTLVDGSAIPGHDPKEQTKPAPAPAKHEDKASLPPPLAGTPPPIRAEGDPAPTDAPFASPTGLYWPVLTRLKQGRTVSYKNTAGKMVGIAGRRFLATRSEGKRYHVGIDLFGDYGDPVVACEDGKIVAWYHFYQGVYCLLVECKSGKVINYGELDKDSLLKCKLKVGDEVKAGQQIGIVGRMTSGSSMLHFETYASGTRSNQRWMAGEKRPAALLDPTRYLLALATATAPASEPAVCPDCPALRALVDAGTVSEKIKRKSADKEAVKALQRHLVRFGYDVGKVDGDYGDKTAAASNAFFRDAGVQDANHNVLSAEEARFIIKKCGEGWKKPVPPTEARLVVYPKGADPKSAGAELTAAPGAKLVLAWEIPNGDVRRIAIRMGGQTQDVTRVTQKANGAWRGALEIALTASDVDAATGKASAQLLIEPAAPGVDYGAAHITLAEPPPPMTIGKFEGAAGDQRGDVLRVPEYDTVELSWDQRGADAIEIYEDTGAGPRFLTSLAPPARSVTVRPIANQTDYTLVARLRDKSLQAKNSVHVTLIPAA